MKSRNATIIFSVLASTFAFSLMTNFASHLAAQDWDLFDSHPYAIESRSRIKSVNFDVPATHRKTPSSNRHNANFFEPRVPQVSNQSQPVIGEIIQQPNPAGQEFILQPTDHATVWEDYAANGPRLGLFPRVSAEALFLNRSGLNDDPFVFDDNGLAATHGDLDLDTGTGYKIAFQLFSDDEVGFELSYLGLDDDEFLLADGPNTVPVFFAAIPADPVASYDITYESNFDSVEANFWNRKSEKTRVGFGFRYFNLREEFDVVLTDDPTTGFYSDSDNDLYGGQVMIERQRPLRQGAKLVLGGKFGGFNNNVDVRAFTLGQQIHREEDKFSFVADLTAGLQIPMSEVSYIQVGYQAIILSDVAKTPDQSTALDVFDVTSGDIVFEDLTLQGLYLGATIGR